MNAVTEPARAKLNLSLDVLGKRPDGYHEMKMLMQTISLADEVTVRLTDAPGISCESSFDFLPNDGQNLAVKAAQVFFAAAGMADAGAQLRLEKRIPVGAGMAGGSTDAAAVLRALNRLCAQPFSWAELERLGERVGSDVPFCVRGGTRLATGRGEVLAEAPPLPDCGIAVCKPDFSIRTPELFRRIDERCSEVHPDTEGLLDALAAGDLTGVARRLFNVFEDVLPPRFREVGVLKDRLVSAGALGAVMTGTGSAVFGLFRGTAEAEETAERLRAEGLAAWAAVPTPML